MKKNLMVASSIAFFMLIGLFSRIYAQVINPKLKPYVKVNQLPIGVQLPAVDSLKLGIDLAVTAINVKIGKKISSTKANIVIEAVIKNIGKNDYVSNANQQQILLYEKYSSPTLIKTKNFQNLAKGQSVKISFSKIWDTSFEFPPSYVAIIQFDPDLYNDNNNKNDDSNNINNTLTKEGAQINVLLGKSN